jgi:hypothetical protein
MRSIALVSLLLMMSTGCAVVVPNGHSSSPAYSKHPHGGPPGQQKKVAKKGGHHGHGASCGHKRKMHDGVWVYQVEGTWYRQSGGSWIVVRL